MAFLFKRTPSAFLWLQPLIDDMRLINPLLQKERVPLSVALIGRMSLLEEDSLQV